MTSFRETNDIIFTTAYKDINRGNWSNFIRSNKTYIDYFYNLADNIKYRLVVYVEFDIKELMIKEHTFNDNIIFIDMNSVDTFYNKYLEKDNVIINSEIFKGKIPENRKNKPECLYSEYNLINHSKINFVANTKQIFPNYKYYSWIDFGTMNEKIENIPNNIDISLLQNKITYHCVQSPPTERISEEEMLKSDQVYFLGSAFIVFRDLVEHFENIWENKIVQWQEQYITDDDQNLILQLYYDSPELFQKIENTEWFGIYRKLQKIKIKIGYGIDEYNIDITEVVLRKCRKQNIIFITGDDHLRNQLFTDPLVGIKKNIYIYNNNFNIYEVVNSNIFIDIGKQEFFIENMHMIPEYITNAYNQVDAINRLLHIQSTMQIKHGSFKEESFEQMMSSTYITGNEKVLEIGGNIGRNTLIIGKILNNNNNNNLLTLESDTETCVQLLENKTINNLDFYIEGSALSKRKLIQKGHDTFVSDNITIGFKPVNTITLEELNNKYNIKFDTLVLDCEGAFYYILLDMPEIIENIKLIIMENDYRDISHKEYIDTVLTNNGFRVDYVQSGGWDPITCPFYNNFYEVWVKI